MDGTRGNRSGLQGIRPQNAQDEFLCLGGRSRVQSHRSSTRCSAADVEQVVLVGELIARELRRPRSRSNFPDASNHVRLFTRITVDAKSWAAIRKLAADAGVTVERFLGVVVADAFGGELPSRADNGRVGP